jgi:hypothetical protein
LRRKKRKEEVLEQQQQHQEQQQASIQPLLQQHYQQQQQQNSTTSNSPLNQFIYALRSSEAQKQYSIRLKMFFNFLGLHGTIEEQAQFFLDKAQNNNGGGVQWTQDNIINFINHHKQAFSKLHLIVTSTMQSMQKEREVGERYSELSG